MAVNISTYPLVLNPMISSSPLVSSDNDQKRYEDRQKEIDEGQENMNLMMPMK